MLECKRSIARSERYSFTNPRPTLSEMMARMISASATSSRSSGFSTCRSSTRHGRAPWLSTAFGPVSWSRRPASAGVSPAVVVRSRVRTSSTPRREASRRSWGSGIMKRAVWSGSSPLGRAWLAQLNADADVDHVGAVRADEDRVEVDLYDLGQVFRQRAEVEHEAAQGSHVRLRPPSIAVQQGECRQTPDHLVRLGVRQRRQAHTNVLEQLDRGAAGAAGDHRPELGILNHAYDHLQAFPGHPLHQEALGLETGAPKPAGHGASGGPDRGWISEPQRDRTGLGLVEDPCAKGLQRDRAGQLRRRQGGLFRRGGEAG